ncbi:hypothetical protein KKI24_25255 [bacterium]|nr:hypothetical protein [bacterium]
MLPGSQSIFPDERRPRKPTVLDLNGFSKNAGNDSPLFLSSSGDLFLIKFTGLATKNVENEFNDIPVLVSIAESE